MIQHVTREVHPSLIEPCVEFYRLLGFVPVTPPASLAERVVWLALGPTQLHLLRSPNTGPTGGHFAVLAQPYEEMVALLRERGIEVQARREHWGAPRSYVRDPAGNLVELMALAPDGVHA